VGAVAILPRVHSGIDAGQENGALSFRQLPSKLVLSVSDNPLPKPSPLGDRGATHSSLTGFL
jgi:hypothetical protein